MHQSGGAAGITVDLCLYPIDTVKTRMQAVGGFFKSGGFKGIYRGIGAVAIGSVPGGKSTRKLHILLITCSCSFFCFVRYIQEYVSTLGIWERSSRITYPYDSCYSGGSGGLIRVAENDMNIHPCNKHRWLV